MYNLNISWRKYNFYYKEKQLTALWITGLSERALHGAGYFCHCVLCSCQGSITVTATSVITVTSHDTHLVSISSSLTTSTGHRQSLHHSKTRSIQSLPVRSTVHYPKLTPDPVCINRCILSFQLSVRETPDPGSRPPLILQMTFSSVES